jgi:hypothetical protein
MPIAGLRQVREGSLQTNASTRCPAGAVEDRFQYRSRFRFVCDSLLEGSGFEPSVPLLRKAHLGIANRRRPHEGRSHLQVQARDGNACLEWLPITFPFAEGPRVRIRLPPGESHTNHRFLSSGEGSTLRIFRAEATSEWQRCGRSCMTHGEPWLSMRARYSCRDNALHT